MIYINQINWLNKYPLEDNKKFIKSIYQEKNFLEVESFFDFINCEESWQREPDKKMNLEKFLKIMRRSDYYTLQLASPDPNKIKYGSKLDDREFDRFLFLEMPYNKKNFDLISKIYKDSFNKELESEKVDPSIIDYYKKRITPGYFKF